MSSEDDGDKPWDFFETMSLAGKVGAILCWWWDDDETFDDAIRGVQLVPKLIMGRTKAFSGNDWWIFYDALGSFPKREDDPELDALYKIASDGQAGRLKGQDTMCFDPEFEEGWDANHIIDDDEEPDPELN